MDDLLRLGIIKGSPEHSPYPDFAVAYRWLAEQMRNLIGEALGDCHPEWPVFAWTQLEGPYPPHETDDPGTYDIVAEFEVPDDVVLISDFDQWHYVLNEWLLPKSDEEPEYDAEMNAFDDFCASIGYQNSYSEECKSDPRVREIMQRSWDRILSKQSPGYGTQASVWALRREWLVEVHDLRLMRQQPQQAVAVLP